ncbi:septation ring formation regulator EzrA [Virgibacillus sp. NKC19-16]|uniref:septation ring formation regulator EzrA n=1 Tax=Virgibacillus salidurans TaxID=2831673 RepID=UPI001F3E438F|nr:septation ring formation regulator EzrA [Virgibacillus sp. NKC19-16]UJL45080.1 septation ring formation regulator EzrA [Virgibacillus sp. NKC19-16]
MAYIIGTILVIIALIIIGLILRKRVYDVVDKYEAWKMDIMDRNIATQLGRIKRLNLSGETQEKFEAWKERLEFIITKELPDIEEHLFDAEEAADRYRFSKAKKTLNNVDQVLNAIEKDIENMLHEVDDLLESEETSRTEAESIEPNIKALRKVLSQNRYQYGKAERHFDIKIDELEEKLTTYHDLVASGDYYEAKQAIDDLKVSLDALEQQIDEFPAIFKLCKHELPAQLDELYAGLKEMKEDGYRVDHLAFEKEIRAYREQLLNIVNQLENGDASGAEEMVTEIGERVKEMYQLLEKEAIAKNYVENQMPSYRYSLDKLSNTFYDTKTEVEQLRQTYYFEDSDMESYLALEKRITSLKNQLEELSNDMETADTSHSQLREELENGFQQIENLQQKHEEFKKRIHNLRKDELEAKEKLREMREELYDTSRKLKKSNIPGVPSFIWNMMETASGKNSLVMKTLEKQPLDMAEVQHALNESKQAIDNVIEQTDVMLEQAYLTEQVIQYANRYRSQYPLLASKLSESERLFRSYEYELALEKAAKAVEEIEPGALKRIEAYQEVAASHSS